MADERPNLLLILTDHWRGDCLGRLGHPAAETPHLDSLSRGGTTFTKAYTPCPSCIAARRSLWTGMRPSGFIPRATSSRSGPQAWPEACKPLSASGISQ